LSTAAPPRPGDYQVHRPRGLCAVSGQVIQPDEPYMSALRETPMGFERIEVKLDHFDALPRGDIIGFWKSVMRRGEAKKKLLVDDSVLCDLLEKLDDVADPDKLSFRFVLALILMRKRLITLETQTTGADGLEVWTVKLRGRDTRLKIVDPKPTEDQIVGIQDQIGQILSEDA
jgi:hypothetical protein